MHYIIGIDPGTTGAVACIRPDGSAIVADIPTRDIKARTKGARSTKRVDARALHTLLASLVPMHERAQVFLEDVQPLPLQRGGIANAHAGSNASMMRTKGAIEATIELSMRCHQAIYVPPRTWKAALQLRGARGAHRTDKRDALVLARELYPKVSGINRAKHHNRAEALLLAHYGRAMLA